MTPEIIALVLVLIGLTVYALFAGADFGAGIWEVNTALQAGEKERALMYNAIGPVWEANHVWLIFVLVMMFGAFPPAFAAICQALWIPLLLALAGIVFRGVGFAFRSYRSAPSASSSPGKLCSPSARPRRRSFWEFRSARSPPARSPLPRASSSTAVMSTTGCRR